MSNSGNQQIDVLKKSLEMTHAFLLDRQRDLVAFKNFGIDTEPLEVLYKHFIKLLEEMMAAPSPREFHDMMTEIAKSIAGVLIVIVPDMEGEVKADMKNFQGFEASSFEDLINNINKNTSAQFRAKPTGGTENEMKQPDNKVEDVVDMLDLKDHVKPGSKKAKDASAEADKETPKPSAGEAFKSIYDKYKDEE